MCSYRKFCLILSFTVVLHIHIYIRKVHIYTLLSLSLSIFPSQFHQLGILQKMKEGAENVERKIQAKVESLKNTNEADKGISVIQHKFILRLNDKSFFNDKKRIENDIIVVIVVVDIVFVCVY